MVRLLPIIEMALAAKNVYSGRRFIRPSLSQLAALSKDKAGVIKREPKVGVQMNGQLLTEADFELRS